MSEFKATQANEGSALVVSLEGIIDEDVTFPAVDADQNKNITLDLGKIKSINSVGIREWLNWIRPLSEKAAISIRNAPKAMVFQFNMVEGFLPPNSKVLSFFAPYFCEKCDREDNVLFTVGKEVTINGGEIKVVYDPKDAKLCPTPDCEAEMDANEAKYLQFLKRQSA